jgi:preprotein translocase subunit SecE
MATTPEAAAPAGFGTRVREFFEGVRAEMHKVTWPDVPQIRSATIGIMVVVLIIGLVIALLDVVLQAILVRGLPSLFGR